VVTTENRTESARETATIDGFLATRARVDVGGETIALWRVANLEAHVDRHALLATPADGSQPPEPPYWAHLWSGAVVLAGAVPGTPGRVLELGCGLGLPGLVAARRGGRVTFLDRVATSLAFVRASARASGLGAVDLVVADLTDIALRARFDLVLAAEILYDRAAFPAVANTLARLLAGGGRALVADARRIDTRAFDEALVAAGLAWQATEHPCREDGLPVSVRLLDVRPALPAATGAG
jgi:predicted nicotinamide N-methyase